MDSRERFIIRRCYETGISTDTAAVLSECSEDSVRTIYQRLRAKGHTKFSGRVKKEEYGITIKLNNGAGNVPNNFWSTMTMFQDVIKELVFDLDGDEEYIQSYVVFAIQQAKDKYMEVKYGFKRS